jgi:preprotein translocase subunit SecE
MAEKTAKKKPNILARIGKGIVRFFRDTRGEIKKVVWPNRSQVLNNCIVVAVFVLVCAVLIFGLDLLFNWLYGLILKLGGSPA